MADLLDANVWIAMSSPSHSSHQEGVEYWSDEASGPIAFCRVTALGLVRVLSGKHSTGGTPLTLAESFGNYFRWREDPDVTFLDEPAGVDQRLAEFIQSGLITSRTLTDAYLAAFAIEAGLRLVTFDQDFARFPGLDVLRL